MQTVYFPPTPDDTFFLEVLGESHYQKHIKEVVSYKIMVERDDLEHKDRKLIANIYLEDDNKFDPGNAVRVDIQDGAVGYLSKTDAMKYRKGLAKIGLSDVVGICRAAAYGKRFEPGKTMVYGVWLSLDIDHLSIGEETQVLHPKKKGCGIFMIPFLLLISSAIVYLVNT